MSEGAAPNPNAPGFAPVSLQDLRRTRNLAVALLALAETASRDDLENLGLQPGDVDEARAALATVERAIPSARNTVLAAFNGILPKEAILTGYARAQRAFHALAGLVVLRLGEKIDNDQAPGSTRVLLEMAKGMGLFVPAAPMAPPKRAALLSLDDLRRIPAADLKDDLLRHSA